MEVNKKFIPLQELEVYRMTRRLSSMAWVIYQRLAFQQRKVWGDQMLESVDSVGANVAEGYARFHFSEKARFYYISRASLSEGVDHHWIDLGFERGVVFDQEFEQINKIKSDIQVRLNNMIKSTYAAKEQLSGKL
jgi:four helix bundle protein